MQVTTDMLNLETQINKMFRIRDVSSTSVHVSCVSQALGKVERPRRQPESCQVAMIPFNLRKSPRKLLSLCWSHVGYTGELFGFEAAVDAGCISNSETPQSKIGSTQIIPPKCSHFHSRNSQQGYPCFQKPPIWEGPAASSNAREPGAGSLLLHRGYFYFLRTLT